MKKNHEKRPGFLHQGRCTHETTEDFHVLSRDTVGRIKRDQFQGHLNPKMQSHTEPMFTCMGTVLFAWFEEQII